MLKGKDFINRFWLGFTAGIVSLFFYMKLLGGFFQQDEWFGFGQYVLNSGGNFGNLISYIFLPSLVHYTPFTILIQHMMFSKFGLNYTAFIFLSLFMHFLVILMVYFLTFKLLKDKKNAFLTSLLFGLSTAGYQATSWVVANIGTHSAAILGILSVILFLCFLDNRRSKYFYLSMVSLFISLLSKEITIGLFILIPFIGYLLKGQKKRPLKKYFYMVFFILFFYLLFRGSMFLLPNRIEAAIEVPSQSRTKVIYNFITIPFKSLSQSVFPIGLIRLTANRITLIFPAAVRGETESPEFEMFAVKRVMEALSLFLSLVLLFSASVIVYLHRFDKRVGIILIGVGWILINSLVFAFAPERSGIVFTVDSRNLYFITVGTSLMLLQLLNLVIKKKLYFVFFFTIILFTNIFWLNLELNKTVSQGKIRKGILNMIGNTHPDLPERVVFYTASDTSYYGLPKSERIMPFQSGFGQTLLGWYYSTEKFPKEFFQDRFLWDITDQDYKEVGDRGFGYYRDFELLKETVKKYNLPVESIVAFSYDSKTNALRDISEGIRQKLVKI